MIQRLFLTGLILAMSHNAVQASVIHDWAFDETSGTAIEATANTGSEAAAGLPTWGAPANNDTGDWATTGSGSMRITGNNSNGNTLATSVVTMPGLDTGTVRYEWDVNWNLEEVPGAPRETFLINRDQGGGNRFRWTLSNPTSGTAPLMRLNLDGNGFAAIPNVTFVNDQLVLDGNAGNLVLRTDVTFGDVGGDNGVTALEASYSYDGGPFSVINVGAFSPYQVANLNDLRLHSKGLFASTEYLDFNRVSVSRVEAIPEPAAGLICVSLAICLVSVRGRRTQAT